MNSVPSPRIVVAPDPAALMREAVRQFAAAANEAVAARGSFSVALSGGSTPKPLYELLATEPWRLQIAWDKAQIFWGDDRFVLPDHKDSNYRMTNDALLSKVPIPGDRIHRVPVETGDADEVAAEYEQVIRKVLGASAPAVPRIDFNILGVGDNGHTASLFPHSWTLREKQRLVVADLIRELDQWRISMTLPLLNHARHIVFLVAGAAKAKVVSEVIMGERDPERVPAQLIHAEDGTLTWLMDRAAAAMLPPKMLELAAP